ncbi:hypothetical protein [uncultured Actinomyces sp.]|uniref:hypothetical protein n=1 Tax=uncultured Actinomyces sp. TaxID=249061 RepID=UPI0028895143|nr:hypothetical protein [uncultured Actinomyces sp.]MDK8351946.1 hypothetical protein [Gleimia europaea]MDK8533384.1 hypothetical protein [Gleimia europaea]
MSTQTALERDIKNEVMKTLTELHDWSVDNPVEAESMVIGSTVFAWYAMPDILRGSGTRFVAKSALLGGIGAYYKHVGYTADDVKESGAQLQDFWKKNFGDLPMAAQVGIGVGSVVVSLKVNSLVERYILHRGERRKRAGKKMPHIRQGLVLGAVAGGVTYFALKNR